MRLSLDAIREHLPCDIIVSKLIEPDQKRLYDFPLLYQATQEPQFESGQLYIADSHDLPETLRMASDVGIICVGDHPLYGYGQNSFLILEDSTTVAEVFSVVSATFWKYILWEQQLLEISKDCTNLQSLIELTNSLTKGNPLICLDLKGGIIAGRYVPSVDANVLSNTSADILQTPLPWVTKNLRHYSMPKIRGIARYETAVTHARTFHIILRDLFAGDECVASLSCSDYDHPLRSIEWLLVNRLGDIIERLMQDGFVQNIEHIKDIRRMFQSLLEGQNLRREDCLSLFQKHNLSGNDCFICICMRLQDERPQFLMISTLRTKINRYLHDTYINHYKSNIVLFIHIFEEQPVQAAIEQLEKMIFSDCKYKIGVSNEFSDIENARHYYHQSCIAINMGSSTDPESHVYHFSHLALRYILTHAAREMPLQNVVHSGVLRLCNSDKELNTNYISTLYAYFKNNQNAVKTAKELYIHRSTLLYRLNQIKEIMGIEWDDFQEMLYIMMSIEIIQMQSMTSNLMPTN